MRLARLPLAALALTFVAACSSDATGPMLDRADEASPPARPQLNQQYFGSGNRAGVDSLTASITAGVVSVTTGATIVL